MRNPGWAAVSAVLSPSTSRSSPSQPTLARDCGPRSIAAFGCPAICGKGEQNGGRGRLQLGLECRPSDDASLRTEIEADIRIPLRRMRSPMGRILGQPETASLGPMPLPEAAGVLWAGPQYLGPQQTSDHCCHDGDQEKTQEEHCGRLDVSHPAPHRSPPWGLQPSAPPRVLILEDW